MSNVEFTVLAKRLTFLPGLALEYRLIFTSERIYFRLRRPLLLAFFSLLSSHSSSIPLSAIESARVTEREVRGATVRGVELVCDLLTEFYITADPEAFVQKLRDLGIEES